MEGMTVNLEAPTSPSGRAPGGLGPFLTNGSCLLRRRPWFYASKCHLAAKRLWRRCDLSIGLPLVVMWKIIGVEGVEAGFHFIQVWIPSLASLVRLRRSTSSPLRGPQCCVARRQELQKVQSIICNITGQGASKRPDAVVKTTALTAAFAKMRCQLLHFRAFLQRAGEGNLYPRR